MYFFFLKNTEKHLHDWNNSVTFAASNKNKEEVMKELSNGSKILRSTDLEMIACNCNSEEEVKEDLVKVTENRLGHVVSSYGEAIHYLTKGHDGDATIDDLHNGDTLSANAVLFDGCTVVAMHVIEIYLEGGSDDYCYMVEVVELF